MVELTIIIVNYNTATEVRSCLDSIRSSELGDGIRVIIVDNASSDGSVEMLAAEYPWVETIPSETNGGYAYGNNLAFRLLGFGKNGSEPSSRYVLLLNPDTVLPPDALAKALAFMEAHDGVGALGPKLVRQDGTLDAACRRSFPTPAVSFFRLSGLARLFPSSPICGRYNLTYLDENDQADVDALVGAFMLLRGKALVEAGILDESFFMYGEDLDLCYRIRQQGWRIVYYPQVTVLHLKGASSRQASRQAIVAFYDAMKIFHDKHYRATTFAPINWLIDLGVTLLKAKALLVDRLRPAERRHVASAKV